MKHFYFTCSLLLFSGMAGAQTFYVNTISSGVAPVENIVHVVNLSTCSQNEIYVCPPTESNTGYYFDIAIDNSQNLYFSSVEGQLYKRNLSDNSCELLGSFNSEVNALTANSKFVYAAGGPYIHKYDIEQHTFSTLGGIPDYVSGGDLFFYMDKLFLLASDGGSNSILMEINIENTLESCFFMDLPNTVPMAAFSLNDGPNSKAYIFTTESQDSQLKEINMIDKSVGPAICTIDGDVLGAAAIYTPSSIESECGILNLDNIKASEAFITVLNPVKNKIEVTTNISEKIIGISLYDLTGKKVKSFDNVQHMSISNITQGVYIIEFNLIDGNKQTKKIIVD